MEALETHFLAPGVVKQWREAQANAPALADEQGEG